MKEFVAAGIQMAVNLENVEATIDRAVVLLKEARETCGASLAVYPESITTGFNPGESAREFYGRLDGIPGKMTWRIQEAAKDIGISVVWPLYEKGEKEGVIYNSAALFDHRGELAGVYRKTHPFPTERLEAGGWTTPGHETVICELPFAKVGLIICYDGDFPELSRVLALKGAEVIVRPSALLRSYEIWELTNCARAYDNHVYFVAVNAIGQDRGGAYYFGHSMIVSPIGQKLALARAGEEIVYARLSADPLKYVTYGTKSPMLFDHLEDRNLKAYEGIMSKGRSSFEPSRRIPYQNG
ncbi:MAG: carbon-nitrogen hydrolase family protein [Candidatus Eremiobacteraeota bacterium]|nr:carbon-nitrogen hydrolase family protein [Candidatus Eremiobacteraeota bacterium]